MTTEYSVIVLETDNFEPKSWSDNPSQGAFCAMVEPTTLQDAQEVARGFNEASLADKGNRWAIVTPAKARMYEAGQIIHVEGNHLLN